MEETQSAPNDDDLTIPEILQAGAEAYVRTRDRLAAEKAEKAANTVVTPKGGKPRKKGK